MRLPNKFGSVSKLSGKRRNPWRARVTVGWEIVTDPKTGQEKERQVYFNCGCYEKKIQAMQALSTYHADPATFKKMLNLYKNKLISLDELLTSQPPTIAERLGVEEEKSTSKITLRSVYNLWEKEVSETSKDHQRGTPANNLKQHQRSMRYLDPIADTPIADIGLADLQKTIDDMQKNSPTLERVKFTLQAIYDYAVIHDFIKRDQDKIQYLNTKKAGNPDARPHARFSPDDVNKLVWVQKALLKQLYIITLSGVYEDNYELFEYIKKLYIHTSTIFILIYTGLRIGEFLDLTANDVNFDDRYFNITKSKTKAGVRIVPISKKIESYLKYYTHVGISTNGTYNTYARYFKYIMDLIGINHTPHDARYTCTSLLREAGVDKIVVQQIIGHKGKDVTDRVYTKIDIKTLVDAIDLL